MISAIKQDHSRFREIIKGKIRGNLKKYITQSELIGKREKEFVSIPIPQIEIPRFQYGPKSQGGVGQRATRPFRRRGTTIKPSSGSRNARAPRMGASGNRTSAQSSPDRHQHPWRGTGRSHSVGRKDAFPRYRSHRERNRFGHSPNCCPRSGVSSLAQ